MGALKKPCCDTTTPTVKPKNKVTDATDNAIQKAEIDRMKRLITDKIKDPELARKAAMIITEMLDKQIK